MARLILLSFFLLLLQLMILTESTTITPSKSNNNPTDFIKTSCKITRYPSLCLQSLSSHAPSIHHSHRQLAVAAISVTISSTRSSAAFLRRATTQKTNSRDHRALRDCVENVGDSMDRLSQSVRELARVARAVGQDFEWHMSNVQTWVSAALTDQDTCLDAFEAPRLDSNLKAAVRTRVVRVAQLTSNALALVNRFASTHRQQRP